MSCDEYYLEERETIDGKPFGGLWFVHFLPIEEGNPILRNAAMTILWNSIPSGFEIRHKQIVSGVDSLEQRQTIGIKFMIWGRAYAVYRHAQKNS